MLQGYMSPSLSLVSLSDDELLKQLSALVDRHRRLESEVVAHIAEVDSRKLYLGQACSSMHAYCVEVLHLSDAESYLRIAVARASRKFPVVLDMLADGRLHLTAIAKMAPHLDEGNADALLHRAVHKTKREVEMLVAEVAPRPDVPPRIRKLNRPRNPPLALRPDAVDPPVRPLPPSPARLRPDVVDPPPVRPAVIEPIAPARYKVEFTASADLRDKLCRAQALLRHRLPDGDLGEIIDEAVTMLLGKLEAKRFGKTETPKKTLANTNMSASSRHVPAAVKREVYERDEGQCAFVDGTTGRRCSCTDPGKLEYHHTKPFAMGGDHRPEGIELRCSAHNAHQAELDFGAEKIAHARRGGLGSVQPDRGDTSRAREPAAPFGRRRCPGTAVSVRPPGSCVQPSPTWGLGDSDPGPPKGSAIGPSLVRLAPA